jgi:hypothetical protein
MHWLGLVKQHLQQDIWLLVGNCMIRGRFYLVPFFVRLFLTLSLLLFFCFLLFSFPSVCIHCCLLGYRIVRDERGRAERYSFVVSLLFVCYRFVYYSVFSCFVVLDACTLSSLFLCVCF